MHNLPPTQYKHRRDLPSKAQILLNRVTLNLGDANKAQHNLADLDEVCEILSDHFGGAAHKIPKVWRRLLNGYINAATAIANI